MAVKRIAVQEAMAQIAQFSAVLDARSPSEFAQDHVPGAVNWPTLDDAQREQVGTLYKQVSPFDARKLGATMAARNIAAHLEREGGTLTRQWRPLVYCWRGGQRSGALATVLDAVGFQTHVLEGGYREFRRWVMVQLDVQPQQFNFHILCGRTGTGKSRLLQALAQAGAQVLDLEGLACHRGSVLGLVPGTEQPTQRAFETALWQAMSALDPSRPVWAESESRTIGRLRVPERLLARLRASACWQVQLPMAARVNLLMHEYAHFVQEPEQLCARLEALHEVRGRSAVAQWQALARAGQLAPLVTQLLEQHYDPAYERSMARNFAGFSKAHSLALADDANICFQHAAQQLKVA